MAECLPRNCCGADGLTAETTVAPGKVLQGYKDVSRLTVITDFVGTPLAMQASVILITWGAGLRG
jgi:hypothetical protein